MKRAEGHYLADAVHIDGSDPDYRAKQSGFELDGVSYFPASGNTVAYDPDSLTGILMLQVSPDTGAARHLTPAAMRSLADALVKAARDLEELASTTANAALDRAAKGRAG